MSDLLIGIALDFSGERPFAVEAERIAQTMLLGRAGDVRWSADGTAALFARAARPATAPRQRRVSFNADPDGGVTLLAGVLFETDALRAELGLPHQASDAALYAAAHARFGERCDHRVVGNYAAIRWFPERRALRIARSPTSDCPIHLWRDGSRLVAASIPRALFAAGAASAVDDNVLAEVLLLSGPDPEQSFYRDQSRVPAGAVFHADLGGQTTRSYWSIASLPNVRFKRDAEYVEAVEEQFRRSLKAHLAHSAAPGLTLSGGLDSQAVAAFAVPELAAGTPLKTFTSVPMAGWTAPDRPWKFGDESDHVRALAAMYPAIEPTFLSAADTRFGERLEARMLLSSWPSYNETNAHWADACYAAAAAAGCDVVLGADLGNASFSYDGLTGFPDWLRRGRWLRLARELRAIDDPRPFWRKLASRAVWPHVPERIRLWRDRTNPYRYSPFDTWSPLREDYARASGALTRATGGSNDVHAYDSPDSRDWRHFVWLTATRNGPEIGLAYQLLHGVGFADPTSFVPLFELCAGIPDEQYFRNGEDRWLARRLLKGRVPELVRTERREGLQAADWPLRFARERSGFLDEINRLKDDPRLAAMFDFDRMARNLAEWDGTDTVAARSVFKINACIGRGISMARFVRYAEGRNAG